MRSNYTELLAWLPATASFTVQVQVCGSACVCGVEVESVWSAFVQVLSKYFVVVALMRAQIRAVGVNVRTSVLTERYRKGVSPESLGAWMAAFTKEQRSLTFRDKSPEMFSAKGQTTAMFFPPSPAAAGAVKGAYMEQRSFCTKAQGGGDVIIWGGDGVFARSTPRGANAKSSDGAMGCGCVGIDWLFCSSSSRFALYSGQNQDRMYLDTYLRCL